MVTVYASLSTNMKAASDFINSVGWGGVANSDDPLARKFLTRGDCSFNDEPSDDHILNIKECMRKGLLVEVSEVPGTLEEAFGKCQHGSLPWFMNTEIVSRQDIGKYDVPSMSAGDVVKFEGDLYIVMGFGFHKI